MEEISRALADLCGEGLQQRFDADKLNALDVYPGSGEDRVEKEDYITDNFNDLKDF